MVKLSERLLVIGGTAFLGRHAVETALSRGYEVTLFNRGVTNAGLFPEAKHLRGDRDGGLAPLAEGTWDAVLDTCGYTPDIVRQSAELLAPRVGHYLFVSTLAVYRDFSEMGISETSVLASPPDTPTDDPMSNYGSLKVLSENEVFRAFPGRAATFRSGMAVGPYEGLYLGALLDTIVGCEEIVAPGAPERPVQWIDARDLAEFMLDCHENETLGDFNVVHPPTTIGDVLNGCIEALEADARLVWCDDDFLQHHNAALGLAPPFWNPPDGPAAGLSAVDASKARAAGLGHRSVIDTVRDTWVWLSALGQAPPPPDMVGAAVWTRQRQEELLAAWRSRAVS